MRRKLTSIAAIITLISLSMDSIAVVPKVDAASCRTTYNIYGDMNGDNTIDVFDVISMRNKVAKGSDDDSLDFNCDGVVDSEDLNMLNDYVLGKDTFFDAYFYDDADEDGVCDILEVTILKSDPDSKDTDGDKLSDFEEAVYSHTSPTNSFTRGLALTDSDDDPDEDKLTNKEEISAGTDPQSADSDMDGISDFDELNKYKTDPNNEDSDNDSIADGDEVELGLDPTSDKSDESTMDNQRIFEHKISSFDEKLSYINTEESPYEISVEINSAGNAEKELLVSAGEFSNISEKEKFIGESVAFSYNEKLNMDTAKIYFKPKEISGSIEDYMIFEYFPDTNYLLPVETKYTLDSAYVETSELGTFTLVNINDNNRSSMSTNINNSIITENLIGSKDIVYDYSLDDIEVVFFVDISNTLTEKLDVTKKSIIDCSQAIFEHSNNSYVEIIGYYTAPDMSSKKLIGYADSYDAKLLNNINSVQDALNNLQPFSNSSNNSMNNIIWDIETLKDDLFSSDCKNKYAFVISNSTYSFTDRLGYSVTIPRTVCESLEAINDSDIHLNFLLAKEIFLNHSAITNFKEACEPYKFGVYNNLETGYFGINGFARIYSDSITDLEKTTVYHVTGLTPQSIPEEVNRNAFVNSLSPSFDRSKVPSADADGNINFKEAAVKIGAASCDENGNLVFNTMSEACDLNELTRQGYEQYMKNKNASDRLLDGALRITPFSDKILYKDTDGDIIPDVYDPYPKHPHDERFELVDSLSHIPKLGNPDIPNCVEYVKAHEQELYEAVYKERFPKLWGNKDKTEDYIELIKAGYWLTRGVGNAGNGYILITDGISSAVNLLPKVHFADRRNINDAGLFLYYYRTCYGGALAFDATEVVENSKSGSSHFKDNMQYLKHACEQMTAKDETCMISTSDTAGFTAWDNSESLLSNNALEMFLAINKCTAGMVAKCSFDGKTYHAKVNYYILDYYDFYEPTNKDGKNRIGFITNDDYVLLALFNEAKPYDVIGEYSVDIYWDKGEDNYHIA